MPSGIYIRTKEYREKMRGIALQQGYGRWMKGRKAIPGLIDKMLLNNRGAKHWQWKGGISSIPGYKIYLNHRRSLLKKKIFGYHTLSEWEHLKSEYNFTCPSCGKKEPEIKLTEDHIVPIVKGGDDFIDNLQPLCKSCNSRKNAHRVVSYSPIIS